MALDLPSNTAGYTQLELGSERKPYLLPLETTDQGTLIPPRLMDVLPIRIMIPEVANPEQHIRLVTRKAVNLKPDFKALLTPLIEEFLRGEHGATWTRMRDLNAHQFVSPWAIHVQVATTTVSFFPYVVNWVGAPTLGLNLVFAQFAEITYILYIGSIC